MIIEIFKKTLGEAVILCTLALIFTIFLNLKNRSFQLKIIEIINFLLCVSINGSSKVLFRNFCNFCNFFHFFFTCKHFWLGIKAKVDEWILTTKLRNACLTYILALLNIYKVAPVLILLEPLHVEAAHFGYHFYILRTRLVKFLTILTIPIKHKLISHWDCTRLEDALSSLFPGHFISFQQSKNQSQTKDNFHSRVTLI